MKTNQALINEIKNICSLGGNKILVEEIALAVGVKNLTNPQQTSCIPLEGMSGENEIPKNNSDLGTISGGLIPHKSAAWMRDEDAVLEKCNKNDPFFIKRKEDFVLSCNSSSDFEGYIQKIKSLDKLLVYCDDNKKIFFITQVRDLLQDVKVEIDEIDISFNDAIEEGDDSNANVLAMIVMNKVLEKLIKCINYLITRKLKVKISEKGVFDKLVEKICDYLDQLGLYTFFPDQQTPISLVFKYFEPVGENISDSSVVREVDYPAYLLRYLDERNTVQRLCFKGRIIV